MRFPIELIRSRHLSRVAVIALIAGLAASCSDNTSRFSSNPFSNPFNSGTDQVASAYPQPAYAAPRSRDDDNYSVGTVPASRPIAAQPLPPIGSVSERNVPQRDYRLNRGEPPIVTGAISASEPQIGGFKAGGWSATGGTTVTAQASEDVNTLSNRYGVPSDAIIKVNGLSGRALSAGQQVVIPVYNASAKAPAGSASPSSPTVTVKTRKVSEEQPYPGDPAVGIARGSVGEVKIRPVATTPAATKPRPVAAVSQLRGIHVVKPGETLTSIAKSYGTTRPRLAKENGIDEWMAVKIGQQLRVPSAMQAATPVVQPRAEPMPTEDVADNRPPKDIPSGPGVAVRPVVTTRPVATAKLEKSLPGKVAKTPIKIAAAEAHPTVKSASVKPVATKPLQTAGVKPVVAKPVHKAKLAEVKTKPAHMAAAKPVEAGKETKLKVEKLAAVKQKPVATRTAQLAQAKPLKPVESSPQSAPAETGTIPAANTAQQAAPAAGAAAKAAEANQSGNPEFRWPVKGRIIQSFGRNSDGINISVPEGTEVKAAEDGVVAYAGSELKGYGNLILIRHPNGYVTAYGHAKELDVKKGDTVKRGQTIATAGQTGNVTSPQVLFEVRKGAAPVDPTRYLSGT